MSGFNAPAWDIERLTGLCAATGRALEPDEPIVAALVDHEGQLKRVDFSLEAWEAGHRPDEVFASWKTVVPRPDRKRKLLVDNDVLMNLLRRLEDATQPQRIAFRFVLMLILMRKKFLRYDRTERRTVTDEAAQNVEQEWWVLTPKLDLSKGPLGKWNDQEKIEVLDPRLDESQTRQVTDQLGEILNAEL